jgi:Na+-translocating ferredoxin:NAD+ oxidoreductase subunit B
MKHSADVYRRLSKHLDNLPGGFPSTESGVELRILRRLFSPEDAELAQHVTLIPEEARVIARRADLPPGDAARRLAEISQKGLIFGIISQKGVPQYAAAQFVIGIWELHVNDLDPDLIRDVEEYLPFLMRESFKVPQLRTIPVNRSLGANLTALPFESAEELVRRAKKFLVAPCICRREKRIVGKGCAAPEEACLVFDAGADLYSRNGLGRMISQAETLDILVQADKAGLVLQPGNSKQPMNICCCCGCCCGVLRSLKSSPQPATLTNSPFVATLTQESCKSCGLCTRRCQMDALRIADGRIMLDKNRCIGCGLCVTACPSKSLTLIRKPLSEQPRLPKDNIQATLQLGRARGKITSSNLVMMMLKSKVDRLRALI